MINIVARALRLRIGSELAEAALTEVLERWLRDMETKIETSEPDAAIAYWDSVLMLLDSMQQTLGIKASIEHEDLRGLVLRMQVENAFRRFPEEP